MTSNNMCSLTNLPTEVLLNVLTYLPAKDISGCRKVSKKLNAIVDRFPLHFQRTRCRLEARCGESLSLVVRRSESETVTELTSEMLSQICRMEVSELTVIASEGTLSHDSTITELIRILEESKQNSIRIVSVKGICLQNPALAQRLLNQFSTSFIQELNLWCPISKQLTSENIAAMDSLCQLRTMKDQEHQLSKDSADAAVLKFARDMRYKLRINIPFVAEVSELSPEVVVHLIKEWIFIPESSIFQITFTGCDHDWLIRFSDICEQEQLRHAFYEFPSKSNPYAHIKMKIQEESNSCVIFPIKDVPARSPIYQYLDENLSNRLDLKIHDQCSNNRRGNWKWGYAGDINKEERRIRDSLVAELNDIASKRDAAQALHQQLVTNNSKLEEAVHELELLVKELKLKKKEYSDLRNVHLSLPHEPLLSPRRDEDDKIDQNFTVFEEAIDYSRCSISRKFYYFLYDLEKDEKDLVALNFHKELSINGARTINPDLACLFIGIVVNRLDPGNYQYYNGKGRNHVFLFVRQTRMDPVVRAEIIVNSIFPRGLFRPNIDIACFLRIPAEDVDEWKRIAPLLPHNRQILVSFESVENGITEVQKSDFAKLQQSIIHSKDKARIILNCSDGTFGREPQTLCGTKASRSALLRESVFVFIFPDVPTFQQRLYEALENGAIPVILSTASPLPFQECVSWKQAVIQIPYARFPEVHFILRSINIADQLEMKRRGRFILENYLLNSRKLTQTILSYLRHRLQIPATDPEDIEAKPLFNNSYSPHELVPVAHPPVFYEKLGPVESPFPSQSFIHNFTVFNLYADKIWNNYPFYTKSSPKFYLEDVPLPSEAEFYEETGFGMRPIAPGSGDTFSEALGGNRPGEQFTVVMVTYNRDDVLYWQLENLYEMPFLNKIIVIWNNIDREPPKTWPKLHVPVQFVKVTRNSLNNRFLPLDLIETEAVLSLDDDMDLKQFEIIFAFRVWRQDRRKIVGFPARHHARYGDGMFYNSNHTCQLSMILTGAAFIHKGYFYAYTYSLPKVIHQKVDEIMNCEDIAMNFLVAHLIREPPIKTTSKWTIRCPNCAENLSNDPQHFEERHECIRFFTKVFGYNPLLFSQYRVDSVLFKTRVPPNHQKCYQMV